MLMIDSFGLDQHVFLPHSCSSWHSQSLKHTLDLILSRPSDNLLFSINAGPPFSDHLSLLCSLRVLQPPFPSKVVRFRSFKDFNLDSFLSDLCFCPVVCDPSDLEVLIDQYNSTLSSLLDKHAPLMEKTITIRPSAPWMTDELRIEKRVLSKAERTWWYGKLAILFQIYCSHLKSFAKNLRGTKSTFFRRKVGECRHDGRTLYQLLNNLMGSFKGKIPPPCIQPSDRLNAFATAFSSKVRIPSPCLYGLSHSMKI